MRFIDIICNKSHTLTCTHLFRSTLAGEVVVLSASCQVQWLKQLLGSPLQQLVEDVEISLPRLLLHDPGLLQEVILDVAPGWIPLEVKVNVHVFPKPTGVVIPVCLGITKCFHDLVWPDQNGGYPGNQTDKKQNMQYAYKKKLWMKTTVQVYPPEALWMWGKGWRPNEEKVVKLRNLHSDLLCGVVGQSTK